MTRILFVKVPILARKQPENQVKIPSQPNKTPTANQSKRPTKRQKSGGYWWLVWLSMVVTLGGTGLVGFLLLMMAPPQVECQQLSLTASDSDRLYCAQLAAQSGQLDQLGAAMAIIQNWPENHPLYPDAQEKMQEWSALIVQIARKKIDQGDLKGAIAAVKKIPVSSPIYPEAQAQITDWEEDWKQGEAIAVKFRNALKAQNWGEAIDQWHVLSNLNIDYWRSSGLDQLMQQLVIEQQAWQQLQDARDLAKLNTAEYFKKAIAIVSRINPKTYVAATAQVEKKKWGQALLEIAQGRFKAKDFEGAVAVAQSIPVDIEVKEEAQDWVKFSRAHAKVEENQGDNFWKFLEALAAVNRIDPQSPLYQQAQTEKAVWQSQLQDTLTLQVANAIAGSSQLLGFQLAINQAKAITPNRPGYSQAQKLIASWQKEMQKIADRSQLENAQQLAQTGGLENLQVAIEIASKIAPSQPLHIEAETNIQRWTKQIQTIEDQPSLNMAKAFAEKGDFISAVQSAQEIRAGRALYPEAQAAIKGWVGQIQTAEDRPILQTAKEFAEQGSLDAAIQTAAQITPGRPLYQQAQNAIATWKSRLNGKPSVSSY